MRCEREGKEFDDSEFAWTEEYGWVHQRAPLHTIEGQTVETDPGGVPGPLTIPGPLDVDDPGAR